jgi:hypothetical protein
LPSEREY